MHQIELMAMQWLQQFHTPASDSLFRYMDFFDRGEFYMMLFPLIWYGFSRVWGIRLFFWMMISTVCNFYFKTFFGLPRPFELDPNLAVITVKNFGFPSGAAQSSFFLMATFINAKKSAIAWICGIGYLVLICFSRVYLGVHFPSDIAGGLAIGAVLFILFWKYANQVEKWIVRKAAWKQLIFLTLGIFMIYAPLQAAYLAQCCSAIFGVGCGLILSRVSCIPSPAPSLKNAFFAMASIAGISYFERTYLNILEAAGNTFLIGLWLSLCLPCLFALKSLKKLITN